MNLNISKNVCGWYCITEFRNDHGLICTSVTDEKNNNYRLLLFEELFKLHAILMT